MSTPQFMSPPCSRDIQPVEHCIPLRSSQTICVIKCIHQQYAGTDETYTEICGTIWRQRYRLYNFVFISPSKQIHSNETKSNASFSFSQVFPVDPTFATAIATTISVLIKNIFQLATENPEGQLTKIGAHLEQWIASTSSTFYNILFQWASKMHKLLILLIETADVLCSMASLEGEVLSAISLLIFSKYLKKNYKEKYTHNCINQ